VADAADSLPVCSVVLGGIGNVLGSGLAGFVVAELDVVTEGAIFRARVLQIGGFGGFAIVEIYDYKSPV